MSITEGPIDPALTGKSTLLSPIVSVAEFAVIEVPREFAPAATIPANRRGAQAIVQCERLADHSIGDKSINHSQGGAASASVIADFRD
jgi:hypothetical protein